MTVGKALKAATLANVHLAAENATLRDALAAIAHNDCGCSPVCQCNSEASLRIWKEWAQDMARELL